MPKQSKIYFSVTEDIKVHSAMYFVFSKKIKMFELYRWSKDCINSYTDNTSNTVIDLETLNNISTSTLKCAECKEKGTAWIIQDSKLDAPWQLKQKLDVVFLTISTNVVISINH